jgi:hypothetical protein
LLLAGKSEFLFNLVKYRKDIFTSEFHRIIYCQPESVLSGSQDFFYRLQSEFSHLEHCIGVPNLAKLNLDYGNLPSLLLIDDLMSSVLNSEEMLDLVTKNVHHNNVTVCFTLQNYYASSRFGKSIIRNCHYRVFFYSRIDQRELNLISSQIANAPNFFMANFKFLFEKFPNDPSHYLLIDGQFRSPMSSMWCRSLIFPKEKGGEINPIIFFPNHDYKREK